MDKKIIQLGKPSSDYEIFTDSGSNLTEDLCDRCRIRMVSFVCSVNGKEYHCFRRGRDDAKTAKRFYNAMRKGADVHTTLINADTFEKAFRPVLEKGHDILYVGISGGLTGTVQAARIAAEELMEEFPGRRIVCVDSYSASLGLGLLVMKLSKLRAAGATLDEAAAYYEKRKLRMNHIFTVDDLKYLKKGGRISAAGAAIGNLLQVKPILKADDNGRIVIHEKVRTRKRALDYLVNMVKSRIRRPALQTIGIAHCDAPEESEYIAKRLKEELPGTEIIIRYYDLCTGSHVGPGTIAIFFLGDDRMGETVAKAANM